MRITPITPTRLPILSQTAEHALRAVLYLARNQEGGPISATEVAHALGAPPNYLSKTLRLLARRGLLRSVRGAYGGFQLRMPPEDISAADVVGAVDDVQVLATCLMGDRPCDPTHPCEAHAAWEALTESVLEPMARTTIRDLLGDADAPSRPTSTSTTAPEPRR